MRMITIIAAIVATLSAPAIAQVAIDSDSRVRQPGAATKSPAPPDSWEIILFEDGVRSPGAPKGKSPGVTSPRDPASGLPTGKR